MRKLTFLSIIVFLFVCYSSVFSYETEVSATIPLTDTVADIAVNSSTGIAAAINETKTLYLIDTQTNTISKTISLDIIPSGVVVDDKKNQAILSTNDGTLYFIDLDTGILQRQSLWPGLFTLLQSIKTKTSSISAAAAAL